MSALTAGLDLYFRALEYLDRAYKAEKQVANLKREVASLRKKLRKP